MINMNKYFVPEGVFQKVVIFNKARKVLLLQASEKYGEKQGTWDLPGGKVHTGETLREAIMREVKEETGISLEDFYLVDVDIVKFSDGKTRVGIIYFAELERNVKLSYEHLAYEWASLKNIKNKTFSFVMASEWIEKAEKIRKMIK